MKKNNKGFTLAELLIVVAIIAVIVAISIPILQSKLERARESTDIANMRNARSLASHTMVDDDMIDGKRLSDGATFNYDAEKGVLTTAKVNGYGKGTATDGKSSYSNYDSKKSVVDDYICVKLVEGKISVYWSTNPVSGSTSYDVSNNQGIGKYVLEAMTKELEAYLSGESGSNSVLGEKARLTNNSTNTGKITLPNGKEVDVVVYVRNYDTFDAPKARLYGESTASLIYNVDTGKLSTIIYYDGETKTYSSWSVNGEWLENTYKK